MVQWADATNQKSLAAKFRLKRDKLLRKFIEFRREKHVGRFRIVDLGGTTDYWYRVGMDWLEKHDIEVTCVNSEYDQFGAFFNKVDIVKCVQGDACNLAQYADNSFHLVHSNSVIEHVGRWPDMRRFANEVHRLAPAYYVQTPYFWFPIDPHFYRMPFYHWMPEPIRLKAQRRFKLGWADSEPQVDDAMRLVMSSIILDATQFRALFPDAEHRFERVAMLPKSMIALRGFK
jgi:Methyltransferase domain.